jgi:hypothetical protein
MASHVNTAIARFASPSTAQRVTTSVGKSAPALVKPIALDRGNVLRIRNGAGTRIRAASGVLWITEENSPDDHVLLPGDTLVLAQPGCAIVLAHRPARVILEVPPGGVAPSAVEMALADGEPGTRIALAKPTPISLSMLARRLAIALRDAIASTRAIARTLTSRWNTVHASSAGAHRSRKVEHAVTEEWSLWRK